MICCFTVFTLPCSVTSKILLRYYGISVACLRNFSSVSMEISLHAHEGNKPLRRVGRCTLFRIIHFRHPVGWHIRRHPEGGAAFEPQLRVGIPVAPRGRVGVLGGAFRAFTMGVDSSHGIFIYPQPSAGSCPVVQRTRQVECPPCTHGFLVGEVAFASFVYQRCIRPCPLRGGTSDTSACRALRPTTASPVAVRTQPQSFRVVRAFGGEI